MDPRALTRPHIADPEALQEFSDALGEYARQVEQEISRLKRAPGDIQALTALFRAIHNIKGDAALSRVETAAVIAHPIESVLARVRAGEIGFSPRLAEALLLALDRLELATEALLTGNHLDGLKLAALVDGLAALAEAPRTAIDALADDLIERVTGFRPVGGDAGLHAPTRHPSAGDGQTREDLRFFRSLALQLESHSLLLNGRTDRIWQLAHDTNVAAGSPIDPVQLEAAVYLHDLGMTLLPEAIWLKVGKLSDEDRRALRRHPGFAAGLVERMEGWAEAARMIREHHEMPDGAGYPAGLKGEAICAGAKLLAIVDAFESVMLKHGDRGRNRSVLRAAAEINANQNQFAPEWVAPFNRAIHRILETA